MKDLQNVVTWSSKLLDYLLDYRQQNPGFKFWLRQRDRADRLSNGYWFQGNDNYLFLSFWARSGGTNMTRSMGFVVYLSKEGKASTGMEVVFNKEVDPELIALYKSIIIHYNLQREHDTKYSKLFEETDVFKSLEYFLTKIKPEVDNMIREAGKEEIFITDEDFNDMLNKTLSLRLSGRKGSQRSGLGIIMVNITWNSHDWQSPSEDKSNHAWVKEGNTPLESWNFDFDNERNSVDKIYGFCQFVAAPLIEGPNNIVIFYSQGKIVGFYGKAEVLREPVLLPNNLSYNVIGDKSLSLVLTNKLENIKERGYLEDKQRMGQNGFIYLTKPETVLSMLLEATALNPGQNEKLSKLKNWIEGFTGQNQLQYNTQPMDIALNQIFFGPPGTGKTYHTINAAVQISDPGFYQRNQNNRTALRKRFQELSIDWKQSLITGQVAFCTFHQSFSYEDFVEGIKPQKPQDGDRYLKYNIEPGIFKKICTLADDNLKASNLKNARVISMNEETFKKAVFYKISLGNSNKDEDLAIYEYCIKNNCIALGYGGDFDFSGLDEEQIVKKCKELEKESFTEQAVNRFIHYIKIGNYILVGNGNHYVRAIGKVTGNYYFDPNTSIRYRHFRSVEWLVKDENIPITEVYDRALSQQTIYKLDEDGIKKDFFVNTGRQTQYETKEIKNFVLIIDEVNRGNVSSIFGELITLIEKDKRSGGSEELEVLLPYSKEVFKVPSNVFIICTMNTADRSIEALDTALRRRFSFKEMPPQPNLLAPQHRIWDLFWKYREIDWNQEPYKSKEESLFSFIGVPAELQSQKKEIWQKMLDEKEPGLHQVKWMEDFEYSGLRLDLLLDRINERIEKLIDKDHRIGHSYFLGVTSIEELREVFRDKVIPLLQEYFFGDYGKIGLVLGNGFVSLGKNDFKFAPFNGIADDSYVEDLSGKSIYAIKLKDWDEADFRSIYA
jgi:5-methylcytosine-specific restriction endonuclease McrBC GTP-binding regulatory subunit McrB